MPYRYRLLIFFLTIATALWAELMLFPTAPLIPILTMPGIAVIVLHLLGLRTVLRTPSKSPHERPAPPQTMEEAQKQIDELTNRTCKPQKSALEFMVKGEPIYMNRYFPIINILSETEVRNFHNLILSIADFPNFDLQLIGTDRKDLSNQMPSAVRFLVAGHIAEIFFFRQDLLNRFFITPRHFQIYTTPEAFQQDGGIMGGCYNPQRESIQIVMARLFEGFNAAAPGVCPFLHEFGHMLDHFDASKGKMGRSVGLYPGLRISDGDIYHPRARELFLKGKRIERDRYLARHTGDSSQPMPIGHPYVFQNDGEFLAGYLEMFFRNPHYFADQNPDLFEAYTELFGYDTRHAWMSDFPHYINANRSFYESGQAPPSSGLKIPHS
jgi:hypothetical protein